MPRYIFDTNDDGSIEWGDAAQECAGYKEIVDHVYRLMEEVQKRQVARGHLTARTAVFVHQEDGTVILTAYGKPGDGVQLIWTHKLP